MQILAFTNSFSKEEGQKMYHDQRELGVLVLHIILFYFNGRQDYMKDDPNCLQVGLSSALKII